MACSTQQTAFRLGQRIGQVPEVTLETVEITESESFVDLLFFNSTQSDIQIMLYPAGHEQAFFILDESYGTLSEDKYLLKSIIGIKPEQRVSLYAGERRLVRLVFDKIDTQHFHLIEGEGNKHSSEHWNFLNVKLYLHDNTIKIHPTKRLR